MIIIDFYYFFSVAERRAVWLCERRSLRKQQQIPGNVCSSNLQCDILKNLFLTENIRCFYSVLRESLV